MAMCYANLGRTDMKVSKISLGGANFGDVYEKLDTAKVSEVVRAALDYGINFIDTAYWYGQGKSEERLGQVLEKIDRKRYFISTKVGRYELETRKMFDFRAEKVLQNVDDSLQRLKLPYVDLINIHDVDFAPDEKLILEETLPALEKTKSAGKARYIGLTGYDLDFICSIIKQSRVKIDTVIIFGRACLHDDSLEKFLPFFKEKGIGVVNASSLSMGLLTDKEPPVWHPASENLRRLTKECAQICTDNGYCIADIARQYSINFPGIDTTLIGVDNLDNLRDSMKSLLATDDEQASIIERLRKKYQLCLDTHWEDYNRNVKAKIYDEESGI